MDFFGVKFSILFLEKHGKKAFDNICTQIIQEGHIIIENCNVYIEIIFKIAFLDFFGLGNDVIKSIIEDIMSCGKVNVYKLKIIHKEPINEIQKYLQSAMNIQ